MSSYPKRGDVFWVKLDPTVGTETQKTRPGLVLSSNLGNEMSSRVVVAPITSQVTKIYPFEAKVLINDTLGKAMLDQVRSVDKKRLGKKLASITSKELAQAERALRIVLDIS